jgi:glycosyltransferase involved in cell wall biosynthesis
MKIVLLVPGSGGRFYCQNCLRDAALARALRRAGHEALTVPLYLPLYEAPEERAAAAPVFFGAVGLYLRERLPLLRRLPAWLQRWLDAPALLGLAARRAGSTRASGLEALTLSMLQGPSGRQARELQELVTWLRATAGPDVVHLSNALLLGIAPAVRRELGVPVVCSLQDEDFWVDAMPAPWPGRLWEAMAARGAETEGFVAPSRAYAERVAPRLGLAVSDVRIIPPGLETERYAPAPAPPAVPTLGYLSRLHPALGFDRLLTAFLRLRRRPGLAALRLRAAGGATGDDTRFLDEQRRRLAAAGCAEALDIVEAPDAAARRDFLQSVTALSVPAPGGEAFGLELVEAMACGVPVVQPRAGGYPELVEATGGGVLYDPAEPEALAAALEPLLADPARARALGRRGLAAVRDGYHADRAAGKMLALYRELTEEDRRATN